MSEDRHLKMKCTLMSEDNGKTWFVYNIFYVTEANGEYGEHEFTDNHDFNNMELSQINN